ncbi:MAG: Hsp20/alpha crystallin family protein [Pirellulales bacterium]|nr:Hsp20/alpha crystallin family protein [Pirellulales bacterium]
MPHQLQVVADMPGVRTEDIDIHFENGELTIHGKVQPRQEGVNFLAEEFGVGDFYRSFRVSEEIDGSRIAATYAAGVLTLTLPKVEAAKPRKIAVQSA